MNEVTQDGSTRRSTRPPSRVPSAEPFDEQPRPTDTREMTTPMTRRTTRTTPRDYPNNEENMDAPLVPFITDPTESTETTTGDDIGGLRRDIAALRDQLEQLEMRMETEERR